VDEDGFSFAVETVDKRDHLEFWIGDGPNDVEVTDIAMRR